MPRGPKPTPITLTDDERAKLTDRANRPTSAQRLATRARIVLRAAEGRANTAIAAHLHLTLPAVRKWRERSAGRRLAGLADEPRPRCPADHHRRPGGGGRHPHPRSHPAGCHPLEYPVPRP